MSAAIPLYHRGKHRVARGFTLVELLFVVAIIASDRGYFRARPVRGRMSGNEASAIASMRTITNAQATFASSCGGGGYANSLADLASRPRRVRAFIPADLAAANPGGVPEERLCFYGDRTADRR